MLTNAGMRDLILRLREKAAALEALCNNLSQERDLLPANVPSDLYEASQSVLSAANSVQEALGEILVQDFLKEES